MFFSYVAFHSSVMSAHHTSTPLFHISATCSLCLPLFLCFCAPLSVCLVCLCVCLFLLSIPLVSTSFASPNLENVSLSFSVLASTDVPSLSLIKAIVDFLLSDPDDEVLWEGILMPPPAPSPRPAPSELGQGSPLYYWKSLLVGGALGACTPAVGERCLRLALRAVGGGSGGEDGGDDGIALAPSGRRSSSGGGGGTGERRGEDDPSLVSSAVVVLRGLSLLARSVV